MDPIAALGAKPALKAPAAASNHESKNGNAATHKVAEDFTALLVGQLVREMFSTVSSESENGPFGDGPGADVYKSMAEGALSEALAKKGLDSLTDRVNDAITPHGDSPMNALLTKVDELKSRLEEALAVERELASALDDQNAALKQGAPDAIVATSTGLERVADDLAVASHACKQLVADLDLGLHPGAQLRDILLVLPESERKDVAKARADLSEARRAWQTKAARNARLARAGLDAVAEARRIIDGAHAQADRGGSSPFSQLDATV